MVLGGFFMADITITAGNVVPGSPNYAEPVKIGTTVATGKILVYDTATESWILASNASLALSGSGNAGNLRLALANGVSGQIVGAARPGSKVTVGTVLTKGRWYVLSTNGNISPEGDLTTADLSVLIGYAETTSLLVFSPVSTGVVV